MRLWRSEAGRVRAIALSGEHGAWWPELEGQAGHGIAARGGPAWLEPVPGVPGTWVQLGPDGTDAASRPARARACAAILAEALAGELEAGQAAGEIAARYEEIDLLYTISEILGRTVDLTEAAQRIVREVSAVVGARRASIMVHDPQRDVLHVVAARGVEIGRLGDVAVDDECSIAAKVFRDRAAISYAPTDPVPNPGCSVGRTYQGASFLSVPILYGAGEAARPVGVINLTDRLGEDAFTAPNKKLVTAIANQVGAAIENVRLAAEEKRRARLATEMELAHHFQLAMLPAAPLLAAAGDVGARCQPAESVGGDFYQLVPVGGKGALGVMVGDVSTHGLGAALLMANAISAAALLAQGAAAPEEALNGLARLIGDELARTEMHLSLFYGVVDARTGVLAYANAGHPQAFLVPGDGSVPRRLKATAPPLGLAPGRAIEGVTARWAAGRDLLCLFTDGLTETCNGDDDCYGEERLLDVVRANLERPAAEIVEAVFRDLEAYSAKAAEDDRTLVVLRR